MIQDLFVFYLGEHRVGLVLDQVVRVFQAVEPMELPNAPDVVLGLVNVRGKLVPVVDVRARFGLPTKEISTSDHMILAAGRERELIFVVDSSVGVVATNVGETFSDEKMDTKVPWLQAVLRTIDGVVFIHDFDKFLSFEEEGVLAVALRERVEDSE